MAKSKKPQIPRSLFTDMKSKGGDGNADRLFKKYSSMLKKKHDVDILEEIDEMDDSYDEYGLGEGDYNWLRMYIRLSTGFKYPTPDILWAVYKEWYLTTKTSGATSDEFKAEIWDSLFSAAAIKHDKANKGRDASPAYLKKKMANLLKAASAKSGKILPNPIKLGASRVSPAMVINADDLDWL